MHTCDLYPILKQKNTSVKSETITSNLQADREAQLKSFFTQFGFQIKEGESSTDLLKKIIYVNKEDDDLFINNSVKALSQLLLANTNIDFHKLESLIEETPEFIELLNNSSEYLKKTYKYLKDGNRIPIDEWISYIKEYNKIKYAVLEKYLKESLLDENNSTKLHRIIKDFIDWFKRLFENAKTLKEVTDALIQQVLLNQKEVIINSQDLKNKERVTLAKALQETTHGKNIIKTFGEFGLILTGSISAAEQGSVFRKTGRLLHDIDWIVPKGFTKDFTKKLKDTFPGAVLLREFDSENYYTHTYIVPPKGYTISNVTFFKPEVYGKTKYIASYDVLDANGNVVSNYRRYYDVKESGKVVENREVYNEGLENVDKNLEAISVDFFQNKEELKFEPYVVNVEGIDLQLSNWMSSFTEKLRYGRAKDLLDYANFIPNDLLNKSDVNSELQNDSQKQYQKPSYNESKLFIRLAERYGREEAKVMYNYLFSDEFVGMYGDWVRGKTKNGLILNDQGEPEEFYFGKRHHAPTVEGFSAGELQVKKHLIEIKYSELKVLKNKQYQITEQLKKLIKREDEPKRKLLLKESARYEALIRSLEAKIDDYKALNRIEYVVGTDDIPGVAISELQRMEELLEDSSFVITHYEFFRKAVDFWLAILNPNENTILDGKFVTDNEQFLAKLYTQANLLDDKLIKYAMKHLEEKASQEMGKPLTKKQLLQRADDVGFFTKYFRDISTVDHPLIAFIYKLIKKVEDKTKLEATRIFDEIDALSKRVDEKYKLYGIDQNIFRQKDEFGNYTGTMIHRFSTHFFAAKRKAMNDAELLGGIEAQKEAKRAWFQKNTITIDFKRLFADEENPTFSEEDRANYIAYLTSVLGKENIEYALEKAQNSYTYYSNEREYAKQTMTEQEFLDWLTVRSPFTGYSDVNLPKKFLDDGTETGFYDKNFEFIAQDEDLLEYYDYMRKLFTDMYYALPYDKRGPKSFKSIPFVARSFSEHFKEDKTQSGIFLVDQFIKQFQIQGEPKEIGDRYDLLTGEQFQEIEVNMTETVAARINRVYEEKVHEYSVVNAIPQNLINQEVLDRLKQEATEQVVSEQSFDLNKIAKMYTLAALSFKHRDAIKDTVYIAREAVKRIERNSTNSIGELLTSHNTPLPTKGLSELESMLDYFISTVFYGKPKIKQKGGRKKIATASAKKQIKKYEAIIKDLKEKQAAAKNDTSAVIVTDYDDQIRFYESKIEQLKKNISITGFGDFILKYVQLKAMGLNIPASIVNIGFGFVANYIEAAGRQLFSESDMHYGYKEALRSKKRTEKIMRYLNVYKKASEEIYEKSALSWMYYLQDKTEFYNQAPLMFAILKSMGMENKFDEEGNPINLTEEEYFELKNKIDQAIARVHGNYDPNKPLLGNSYFWGRAVTQFRKWAIEGFANRFEKERYDTNLGQTIKGRYRSGFGPIIYVRDADGAIAKFGENTTDFGNIVYMTGYGLIELAVKIVTLGYKTSGLYDRLELAGVSKIDIANIRRNMMETVFYLSMVSIAVLMKGLIDDDDDDEEAPKIHTNALIYNMILRLQSDILFYSNPKEFERIVSNPMAIMRLGHDLFEIYDVTKKVLFDGLDPDLQSGPFKGENRIMREIIDFVPIGSQFNRVRRIAHKFYDD